MIALLNIKTKVGILPMEIIRRPSGYYISMTQGTFEIVGSLTDEEQTELINALGIKEDDLEKRCPCR